MNFTELNYPAYEQIFVKNCNGCVVTGLDRPKITKPDAQYVDWFILLPAIMNDYERLEYLGSDYQKITKDTLNAMRKGRVRREYIDALFWKEDAIAIVTENFLKNVPQAIVGANRKRIVEELWGVIQKDIIIPDNIRQNFEKRKEIAISEIEKMKTFPDNIPVMPEWFCEFLAAAFVFAMTREKVLSDELQLSPPVAQVINDLENGKTLFLNTLIDSMCAAVTEGVPDEHNNRQLKSSNDSEYTNDDFRYFVMKLLELKPTLDYDHALKFNCLRLFAIQIDRGRLISDAGDAAVDALYEKYKMPKSSYVELSFSTNMENASYDTVLSGQKIRIEIKRNPDGIPEIYVIGQETNEK